MAKKKAKTVRDVVRYRNPTVVSIVEAAREVIRVATERIKARNRRKASVIKIERIPDEGSNPQAATNAVRACKVLAADLKDIGTALRTLKELKVRPEHNFKVRKAKTVPVVPELVGPPEPAKGAVTMTVEEFGKAIGVKGVPAPAAAEPEAAVTTPAPRVEVPSAEASPPSLPAEVAATIAVLAGVAKDANASAAASGQSTGPVGVLVVPAGGFSKEQAAGVAQQLTGLAGGGPEKEPLPAPAPPPAVKMPPEGEPVAADVAAAERSTQLPAVTAEEPVAVAPGDSKPATGEVEFSGVPVSVVAHSGILGVPGGEPKPPVGKDLAAATP